MTLDEIDKMRKIIAATSPIWASFLFQKTYISVEAENGIGQTVPVPDRDFVAFARKYWPACLDEIEFLQNDRDSYRMEVLKLRAIAEAAQLAMEDSKRYIGYEEWLKPQTNYEKLELALIDGGYSPNPSKK